MGHGSRCYVQAIDQGPARPITPEGVMAPFFEPVISPDGRSVYATSSQTLPLHVYRVSLDAGHRQLWKDLAPADSTAVRAIYTTHVAPDGSWYYYSYWRNLSDLYVVSGWR